MPANPLHPAQTALAALWHAAGLPAQALACAHLPGCDPVLPASFDVASAAQASLGAAALAAAELGHQRGAARQQVSVDRQHATLECTGHFAINGRRPDLWDKLSGLYPCGGAVGQPGFVRIHANFAHHRDGALRLLGLPPGPSTERAAVTAALASWPAEAFEQAAAENGLVVAAARTFEQWDAHPQGLALAGQPLVSITPINLEPIRPGTGAADAPLAPGWMPSAPGWAPAALRWAPDAGKRPDRPGTAPDQRPLAGLRVLDLTRILAGPVAGRCLAAYGADVMLVNAPHLPNIEAIADTSRGKLSTLIDLRGAAGRAQLMALADGAHVFLQGYRPGALARRGFSAQALAARCPGIVVASLSAYGATGPWAGRRGFDSLVQTATGFNLAEGQASGSGVPTALPMQILDYAAGHLLAFGISAALWRQATQGGSWQVAVSLAGVGLWLRSLGRVAARSVAQSATQSAAGAQGGAAGKVSAPTRPAIEPWLDETACGFGDAGQPGGMATLRAVRHAAQFSATPARWVRPSMPPGSHPPVWPP